MQKSRKSISGPLNGIRILDLSRLYPGPLATMMMADMGAEVIKIEDPGSPDPMRSYPPFVDGHSAGYLAVNRSKKSLALNYSHPEGRKLFFRLLKSADVVVESFRPGVLAQLELDYERARKANPGIIYVSLTGYGQTGPYSRKASHDLNYLAYSGILSITGTVAQPVIPGPQIADIAGGAYLAVIGTLAALFQRQASGKGQHLDVSMLDGTLPLMSLQMAHFWASGEKPRRGKMVLSGGMAAYNVYRCADGKFMALAAIEPKFWETFCDAVARPQWKANYFADGRSQEALIGEVGKLFLSKPRSHWIALAEEYDICLSPVLEADELEQDPHLNQRGMFVEQEVAGGKLKEIAPPLKFGNGLAWPAPELGEDTQSVLRELGFSEEEIHQLAKKGLVSL